MLDSSCGYERRKLFDWCSSLQGQRETLVVVVSLPDAETNSGRIEIVEAPPAPELFLVDPVAPFDLAVLLGAPRLEVAMPDPQRLHGDRESEGKLLPVVALQLSDSEGEPPTQLLAQARWRTTAKRSTLSSGWTSMQ